MSKLNHEQIAQLRHQLEDRRAELRKELHQAVNDGESYLDIASDLTDPGDSSFANLTIDLENAATTRDIGELRAIDAALTRIDNGTYGDCVDCEVDVPFERLKVQPTAERCAPCQEAYERTHGEAARGGMTRGPTL